MTPSSPAATIQENLQELFQGNLAPGDAYIRFQLTTGVNSPQKNDVPKRSQIISDITFLLSMEQVQESLIVEADRITPLPNMPESVIGIMNSKNHVFCVFDLAQLLKLHSQSIFYRQYQIIVLQTTWEKPIYIGLAVTHLQGIVRLTSEQIDFSLDGLPFHLIPYLCGVAQLEESIAPILDFNCLSETLTKLNIN